MDTQLNKVIVTGNITNEEVIRVLQKIGKSASTWEGEEINGWIYNLISHLIKIALEIASCSLQDILMKNGEKKVTRERIGTFISYKMAFLFSPV